MKSLTFQVAKEWGHCSPILPQLIYDTRGNSQTQDGVAPMPLTATAIRHAKPGKKPIRMFDSGGLLYVVKPFWTDGLTTYN